MGIKEYGTFKRHKGVLEPTTNQTDHRIINETYLEVYRHHGYLTRLMVSRMSLEGWTMTEIIKGELHDGIFFPKSTFSFQDEKIVKGFPIHLIGRETKFWRKPCINYLNRYLGKSLKNNRTSLQSTRVS